ncbi:MULTISPECIES: sensor domain-containing diguanylate cyclase [unclassified Pseudomonas]|uniref:sensor domain-containing diguanylate cyclase n=1 Tax=unclassified Pseudomonas TaxID=196821 RepID=UPI0021C986CA|nr:sensor domain-containing diguanylate cyclase [Pseudomonas sp. 20P_3.2_Bac4]MCU1745051.1 sensor domain-containing diguanylate cyclase [Pseudomonas sp. 20P_3.2_Bac5]
MIQDRGKGTSVQLRHFFRWDLRSLILLLTLITALVTLLNSFYASYRVQYQLLIDNALEANHAYASKLASSTETYLQASQQQLAYAADLLGEHFDDLAQLNREAVRLRLQTNTFNSIVITDDQGVVRSTSPDTLQILGKKLQSEGALAALRERRPLISSPYMSAANNLIIFISQPVFDKAGRYRGLIGGSIYLKHKSILNELLGEHYYKNGSYLYVVDSNRRLLYHPDADRVGSIVGSNSLIDTLGTRDNGTQRVINSQGMDMLAGFASVPSAHWGIVAQRSTESTLEGLDQLLMSVIFKTIPLAIVSFILIWWFSRIIAQPLRQLAAGAKKINEPETSAQIESVRSWYFESSELKRALLIGLNLLHERLGKLNHDIQTDPLTGLRNRRGLDLAVTLWQAEKRPFSVIAIDIDHFKQVNDTYGHAAGDEVLQALAEVMRGCSRDHDVICRSGGEEFFMLLPGTRPDTAARVAERLRHRVEQMEFETVGNLTLSMGVANWPLHSDNAARVFEVADEQLYQAKIGGRNRVRVADAAEVAHQV